MSERILIVDDKAQDRRLIQAILEPYGYDVRAAASGDEAVRLVETEPPELILLDVVMPEMSGYDVCRLVRASEATRLLPIVMLTASPEQDKVAGIEAGADDFIVKPVERHELLARVRSLLRIKSYHDTITRQAAELARLNRTLEDRVAAQVAEILALRGLGGTAVFRHEGEMWTIAYEGPTFRLRDTKGLRYIAALLREPGRERHVLDLVATEAPDDGTSRRPVGGDAGPVLDAAAKSQYRERLDELADELREAEERHDVERAASANQEREVLMQELSAAVGLGGRDRRAASDAERARVNVTRAVKAVLERIAEHSPALGRHLDATVRTGLFCAYVPDPRSPVRWEL